MTLSAVSQKGIKWGRWLGDRSALCEPILETSPSPKCLQTITVLSVPAMTVARGLNVVTFPRQREGGGDRRGRYKRTKRGPCRRRTNGQGLASTRRASCRLVGRAEAVHVHWATVSLSVPCSLFLYQGLSQTLCSPMDGATIAASGGDTRHAAFAP